MSIYQDNSQDNTPENNTQNELNQNLQGFQKFSPEFDYTLNPSQIIFNNQGRQIVNEAGIRCYENLPSKVSLDEQNNKIYCQLKFQCQSKHHLSLGIASKNFNRNEQKMDVHQVKGSYQLYLDDCAHKLINETSQKVNTRYFYSRDQFTITVKIDLEQQYIQFFWGDQYLEQTTLNIDFFNGDLKIDDLYFNVQCQHPVKIDIL